MEAPVHMDAHDMNEEARECLQRYTVFHFIRPRALLHPRNAQNPRARLHPELNRRGILYFLRLAPLTRRVGGFVHWTATGSRMPVANQAPAAYEGIYLGKYGFTTVRARDRFTEFELAARDRNFPSRHDMVLVFEMAIIGIPGYMLRRMEQALRNYLERRGVRTRWHALGNGGDRPYAEQIELVFTDRTGNSLSDMYEGFIDALENGRQAAREEVTAADLLRAQQIREQRMALRHNHRRESHRVRVMLVRRSVDPKEELRRLRDDHEAAVALVEVQTPQVQAHAILERHLIQATQQLIADARPVRDLRELVVRPHLPVRDLRELVVRPHLHNRYQLLQLLSRAPLLMGPVSTCLLKWVHTLIYSLIYP